MKEKSQRGDNDHAPAKTSQGAKQSGENRHQQHRARKLDQAHLPFQASHSRVAGMSLIFAFVASPSVYQGFA